jgi:hypothetical protein
MLVSRLKGPPYGIELVRAADGAGHEAKLVIGADEDAYLITLLVCRLEPVSIGAKKHWEFSFEIHASYVDKAKENLQTQDAKIAADIIPPEARRYIMDAVCASLRLLVVRVKPRLMYGVTRAGRFTKKTLLKYHTAIKVLEDQGYVMESKGTDRSGRRFWTMRRSR